MALLADQADRMKSAWDAAGYMMQHDEVRILNWDVSCQQHHHNAGTILAGNARDCSKLLDGCRIYAWNDMFDPYHNAVKDYYLVNSDLAGSWEGLGSKVIIVNWNFDRRDESLKFFADRGELCSDCQDDGICAPRKVPGQALTAPHMARAQLQRWL